MTATATPAVPAPGNGRAIAALILAIAGLVVPCLGLITAIIAIVLGAKARKGPAPGMALAGIIIAAFAILGQVVIALLAAMLIPAVGLVRERANEQANANSMRQLVTASIAWSAEFGGKDEVWPPDLPTLVKDMQLPQRLLIARGGERAPQPHFLFVRPVTDASGLQPVMLMNPACLRDRNAILVCYGDGHTQMLKHASAAAIWAEAQRLAASPAAATTGIKPEDWTTIGEDGEPTGVAR